MRTKQAGSRWHIPRTVATALLLATALAAPAITQEKDRRRAPEVRGKDDIQETIQGMMLASMKKSLELTRDQEMEVVPRVQQLLGRNRAFGAYRPEAPGNLGREARRGTPHREGNPYPRKGLPRPLGRDRPDR